ADEALTVRFASSNVDDDGRYAIIRTDAIPGITHVHLYEETIAHVKESHAGQFPPQFSPEFPSIVEAVGNAIRQPTKVEMSYGGSVTCVDHGSTNAKGHPLQVPVKILHETSSGRVKTFFFARAEYDSDA